MSGGPGPEQSQTFTGSKTVMFTVRPGLWNVSVEAYGTDGGEKSLKAEGSTRVKIKSYRNDPVVIYMTQLDTGGIVIDIAAIEGVTVPVTGGIPVMAITPTAQYTGTVSWEPAVSGTFAASTRYTATITLTAKSGYTLQGVAENFFTVEGTASAAANAANSGVITAVFPSTVGTKENPAIIDIAAINGVPVPATGAIMVTAITANPQYTGTVTWSPNHATFAAGTVYTATITLSAKEGYTMTGVGANFFTVAGTSSPATNAADSGVITAVFPAAAITVNIPAIYGITTPRHLATPVTSIGVRIREVTIDMYDSSGDGWDAAVYGSIGGALRITVNGVQIVTNVKVQVSDFKDSNHPSGQSGTNTYTFNVAEGDTVQFYWVQGDYQDEVSFIAYYTDTPPSPAFNPSGWSGSNALIYRQYNTMTSINGGTLLGSFTAINTSQYTGTVTWSPNDAAFAVSTYTATITLTPKTGYTMQGVTANFFTVAGAAPVSNPANSGVVTAVFPATRAYALGDTGPGGGKIFYYSAAGFTMTDNDHVCHYLEAAPDNASSSALTYSSTSLSANLTIGTTSMISIGMGRETTALILSMDPDAPAARACKDYRGPNNLTDWFLPSWNEMEQLYTNRSYVGNIGTNSRYWSTREFIGDNNNAWLMAFTAGMSNVQFKFNTNNSTQPNSARAIRAF